MPGIEYYDDGDQVKRHIGFCVQENPEFRLSSGHGDSLDTEVTMKKYTIEWEPRGVYVRFAGEIYSTDM